MRQGRRAQSAIMTLGLFLAASGLSRAAFAEDFHLSAERQGIRTAPLFLLSRADVQKELTLTPEQIREAQALSNQLFQKAMSLRGKSGEGVLAARRAVDDQQTRWLNEKLTTAQLDRLHQLDLRWEGPSAWGSRPIIGEYLHLTDEQREKLGKDFAEHTKARLAGPRSPASEQEFSKRVLLHLTDEQRALWFHLLGKPMQFVADLPPKDTGTVQASGR